MDADKADNLAGFLDRDECVQGGQQAPPQPGSVQSGPLQQVS
jgi:hypothetical protein